ncbi:MAG: DUF1801 domain-containing protein [Bacteroidetes bacterium]|jgi:hypothetical protein|nr:DUF1801 domain-containing protein [Bacteroidota bacterium]
MGKVAEIKTKETNSSVDDFINGLKDEKQRNDSFQLVKIMQNASNENPKMWGSSLIGFGIKRYKSPKTGREVDWFKIGFSPRKANLSIHLVFDLEANANILKTLGKHKTGAGCLYINKLDDVDLKVLENLIAVALNDK